MIRHVAAYTIFISSNMLDLWRSNPLVYGCPALAKQTDSLNFLLSQEYLGLGQLLAETSQQSAIAFADMFLMVPPTGRLSQLSDEREVCRNGTVGG